MSNIDSNIDLIFKGGFLMYPLLLLSIYVVAIIIYKIMEFSKKQIFKYDFADQAIEEIRTGDIDKCENILSNSNSPLARVMETAIGLKLFANLPSERIEPEIERVGMNELQKLQEHLRGLEIVAGIAPLIGLLGTVIGMVKAFAQLAESETRIDPAMLAGGIWEALITTIGGLVVAIPAFAAYYIFDNYVDKQRLAMKSYATQILNLEGRIKDSYKKTKKKSTIKSDW